MEPTAIDYRDGCCKKPLRSLITGFDVQAVSCFQFKIWKRTSIGDRVKNVSLRSSSNASRPPFWRHSSGTPCGLCCFGQWLMSCDLKRNLSLEPANRPLTDLKESSTTIAADINDLPATSPHGSYSEHDARNLGFATDPNPIRGTATAHRDTHCNLRHDRLDHC